jgi:L-cystine uptake protein TcyP (sodium:dicarboxylate symporter family)
MAGERRTKAQKEKATVRRMEHSSYSFTAEDTTRSQVHTAAPHQVFNTQGPRHTIHSLFAYDATLIYRDLRKTIVITVVIFAVLLGIRSYLG